MVGTPGEGRNAENKPSGQIEESGEYTSKEDVAAYLSKYGHLPENYITKKEAKALGWVSSEGNLQEAAPGKSIGGDHFGNYEEYFRKKMDVNILNAILTAAADTGARNGLSIRMMA